jgi:hypothetical protein
MGALNRHPFMGSTTPPLKSQSMIETPYILTLKSDFRYAFCYVKRDALKTERIRSFLRYLLTAVFPTGNWG